MATNFSIIGCINPNVIEMATQLNAKYRDCLVPIPEAWWKSVSGFTSTAALRTKFPIDLTVIDGFREWVGERKEQDSDIEAFFVDSKPWERSINVPLDVAESGQFDGYINKVPALVRAAQVMPNRLIAALLQNGKTTTKGFDGVVLFGTTHPVNLRDSSKGNFTNLLTGKPFSRANLQVVRKYFRGLKAPDGKTSLGLRLTHVLGDTSLEDTFDQLFKKKLLANDAGTAADDNIYYGSAQPIIAPELDTEPGVWYGIAANTGVMPFETQFKDGADPQITILGDGTETARTTNLVKFIGKLFGNAGAGVPHVIVRVEPT